MALYWYGLGEPADGTVDLFAVQPPRAGVVRYLQPIAGSKHQLSVGRAEVMMKFDDRLVPVFFPNISEHADGERRGPLTI